MPGCLWQAQDSGGAEGARRQKGEEQERKRGTGRGWKKQLGWGTEKQSRHLVPEDVYARSCLCPTNPKRTRPGEEAQRRERGRAQCSVLGASQDPNRRDEHHLKYGFSALWWPRGWTGVRAASRDRGYIYYSWFMLFNSRNNTVKQLLSNNNNRKKCPVESTHTTSSGWSWAPL